MENHLLYDIPAMLIAFVLGIGMLLAMYLGKRAQGTSSKEAPKTASDAILGALFGLLAFLLAISYNMAESRYAARKADIVQESNAIGTAALRTQLYPTAQGDSLRSFLKKFTAARIAMYRAGRNPSVIQQKLAEADAHLNQAWSLVVSYSKQAPTQVVIHNQMIPALNDLIDTAAERNAGIHNTVPDLIILMLLLLCVVISFLSGYYFDIGAKDRLARLGFVLLISIVIYIILDLDRPRRGLINMNKTHALMEQVYEQIPSTQR